MKWVGERSNDVGGHAVIAAMIARTGLGWANGKEPFVEVGRLGFSCLSDIASGLNGCTPVVLKPI